MARPFLLTSGAQTASTTGSAVQIAKAGPGSVTLNIISSSGTNPTLHAWLEGSDDGTYWSEVGHIHQLVSSGTSTDVTGTAVKRNVCTAATTASNFYAAYYTVPSQIRLRWEIGGTSTPTFTFNAYFRG